MSRRKACWLAVLAGLAGLAAYLIVRATAPSEAVPVRTAGTVPVPAPEPTPELASPAPKPAGRGEPDERPLPTWVRIAIVAAALLAFLAVSLVATRSR